MHVFSVCVVFICCAHVLCFCGLFMSCVHVLCLCIVFNVLCLHGCDFDLLCLRLCYVFYALC